MGPSRCWVRVFRMGIVTPLHGVRQCAELTNHRSAHTSGITCLYAPAGANYADSPTSALGACPGYRRVSKPRTLAMANTFAMAACTTASWKERTIG